VRKLEDHFEGLQFHHVTRDNNVAADVLSKLGSKRALVPASVFVQDLRKPPIRLLSDLETSPRSVLGSRDILMTEAEVDWRLDFIAYIMEKHIPEDKVEREKIVRRAANYVIIGTELYRRSAYNGVLMKCILRSEGLELLQEIHGGECGNHATSANLVGKAYRSGFLLAYRYGRCSRPGSPLQGLPILCQVAARTGSSPEGNSTIPALCHLGP
jgi:hypothetical protein